MNPEAMSQWTHPEVEAYVAQCDEAIREEVSRGQSFCAALRQAALPKAGSELTRWDLPVGLIATLARKHAGAWVSDGTAFLGGLLASLPYDPISNRFRLMVSPASQRKARKWIKAELDVKWIAS